MYSQTLPFSEFKGYFMRLFMLVNNMTDFVPHILKFVPASI